MQLKHKTLHSSTFASKLACNLQGLKPFQFKPFSVQNLLETSLSSFVQALYQEKINLAMEQHKWLPYNESIQKLGRIV